MDNTIKDKEPIIEYIITFTLILFLFFSIYYIYYIYQKLFLKVFDKHHTLINAALPITITTIAPIFIFMIGTNDSKLQLQFFIHLTILFIILALLFFIIDFLMTIQKQNKLIDYKVIKNKELFFKLNKIYEQFSVLGEKNMSFIEEELLYKNLDKVIGYINNYSRGKYELTYGEFTIFWNQMMDKLENKNNSSEYCTVTDFTQVGNIQEERLKELEKNSEDTRILSTNINVKKLFILSGNYKICEECSFDEKKQCTTHINKDNENICRQYAIIRKWHNKKENNVEIRCIDRKNIKDELKTKTLDIGIFSNIAMGIQLSDNSKTHDSNLGDILRYNFYFDEFYIKESLIEFDDLWKRGKRLKENN